MTTAPRPLRARWRVLLLAALTALATLFLSTALASASGLPAAETRVGASHPAVVHVVGVAEHIAAGQHPGRAPSQLQVVVGHCVAAEGIDGSVVLVRGGTNTAERFANGSGVTRDAAGNLSGVSVNSGRSVEEAAQGIKNNQIGVSTVGDVRNAGGTVTRDPTPYNPNHCLISGCSGDVLSDLFTPTIKNPWK